MGFLDDLENNLKSLESSEEVAADTRRDRERLAGERALEEAAAPWSEELKKGPFTQELLKQAARVGHSLRVKVHVAWLGSILRLEARGRRLELRPTPKGVVAAYIEDGREVRSSPLDLGGNPEVLVRSWLAPAA